MTHLLDDDELLLDEVVKRFLDSGDPLAHARSLAGQPDAERSRWAGFAELGWFDIGAAMLTGDDDRALFRTAMIAEALGRSVQPEPFVPGIVAVATVAQHGATSDDRKRLEAGEALAVWCEPGLDERGGIAPAFQATAGADGAVTISGSSGPVQGALSADLVVVTYDLDGALHQALVPSSATGVTVTALESLDLTRRFGQVQLAGVAVPADAVLGPVSTEQLDAQVAAAAVLTSADMVGSAARTLEFTREYLGMRFTFGRELASYQAIKHRVADSHVAVELSRATVYEAAVAPSDERGVPTASIAKAYVGEPCAAAIEDCLQLHGGIGFTWEHDIHLYLRRVRTACALAGGRDWHLARIALALRAAA